MELPKSWSMQSMQIKRAAGFTLIEVLVVAPIIILFIGTFIGLILSLTGDSLQSRTNNEISYQVQAALDAIEAENGRASGGYLATTGAVTSPQGSDNGTAAFTVTNNDASNTDTDVLILQSPATTLDPVSPDRQLIRYNTPNACNSTNVNQNDYYPVKTVYFVSSGTLWQRTILPNTGTPCSTPWQKSSCQTAGAGVCPAADTRLADNVTSFSVKYLSASGTAVSSANPTTATTINVTIKADKTVAGKVVSYQSSFSSTIPISGNSGSGIGMSGNLIGLGIYSSCVKLNTNSYCWGDNSQGQLGLDSSSPGVAAATNRGSVPNGVTFTYLSSREYSSCAIGSDGKAYCWGQDNYGQLGNAVSGNPNGDMGPVAVAQGAVPAGVTFTQITMGGYHACAIGSNGKAYCWGYNSANNLGDGTFTQRNTPVAVSQGAVPAGVTFTKIAAGWYHTCAIGSDGKAYCWGDDSNGALGNTTTTSYTSTPVAVSQGAVPAGVTFTQIAAGISNTCAIGSDGKAYCWGDGHNGELGDNSGSSQFTAVAVSQGAVPAGVSLVSIAPGYQHTCAIGSNGKAYCWGYNSSYNLGDGTNIQRNTPVAVIQGGMPSGVTLAGIATGGYHTCALSTNNKVYCWGDNSYGQIGNGTSGGSVVNPTTVLNLP